MVQRFNLGRDGPLKEVIQICSNEVDVSWGRVVRRHYRGGSIFLIFFISSQEPAIKMIQHLLCNIIMICIFKFLQTKVPEFK